MKCLVVPALTLAFLTSCAGENKQSSAATDSSAAQATAPVPPPVLTITARDFAYEAPDTISGGMTTIRLVNQGPDLHHVQLIKLGEGKTFADFTAAMREMKPGAAPPSWWSDVAGPNSPVPGGETLLTENLEPGNYAVACFIDTPDKVPHFAKGMLRSLVVTAAPATPVVATPIADVEVSMSDYAWDVTPALSAGKHVIKLQNTAAQSHEMFIVQLAPGKTAADMMKWSESYKGPPPGKPMGGISGMASGGVAYLSVDLPAGDYLLMCFLPDAKDGKPHLAHGMLKSLTVS